MTNIDQSTGEVFDDGDVEILPPGTGLSVFSGEVDLMIATSKKFPRPKDKEISVRILERATLTSSIAEECLYSVPRDSKKITGPSIRFAEIIRSCYRNIWVRSWVVEDGGGPNAKSIKVAALAYDCENNEAESSEVRRSIMTSPKNGPPRKYSNDMVNTTIMAAQAIAKRNAILALVPKALWIDGLDAVEQVIKGTEATLNAKRIKILEDFKKVGIQPSDLFAAFNIESEQEISLNDLPQLRGMWARLNDGESIESVLGMAARRSHHATVESPMGNAPPAQAPQANNGEAADTAVKPPPDKPAARQRRNAKQPQAPTAQANPGQVEAEGHDDGIPVDGEPDGRDREAEQQQEAGEAQQSTEQMQQEEGIPGFLRVGAPAVSDYAKALKFIADFKGEPGDLLNWWRKLTSARAAMSFEESGHLGKVYNAKFNDLNK